MHSVPLLLTRPHATAAPAAPAVELCGGKCMKLSGPGANDFANCGGCSTPAGASIVAAASAVAASPFNCANKFGTDRCVDGQCRCRGAVTDPNTRVTSPGRRALLLPQPLTGAAPLPALFVWRRGWLPSHCQQFSSARARTSYRHNTCPGPSAS